MLSNSISKPPDLVTNGSDYADFNTLSNFCAPHPLAPIFMPRYADPSPWSINSHQISALFSARRYLGSPHLDALKAPFVSAKLRRKGTKSVDCFSHICVRAARNARSAVAAVIEPSAFGTLSMAIWHAPNQACSRSGRRLLRSHCRTCCQGKRSAWKISAMK